MEWQAAAGPCRRRLPSGPAGKLCLRVLPLGCSLHGLPPKLYCKVQHTFAMHPSRQPRRCLSMRLTLCPCRCLLPHSSIRRLNWHFDMVSMLGLLLLVLPYYHCYFALSSKLPPLRAGVGAAALWCAGVAAFWRLGGAVPGIPAAAGWRGLTMLEVGQGVG